MAALQDHLRCKLRSNNTDNLEDLSIDRLAVRVNCVERSLFVRRGSIHSQKVNQILVNRALDLSGLPCGDGLLFKLGSIRSSGKRPLIIDAGANIGLSSINFAAQVPDSLVVATETDVGNFQILVANTEGLPILPLPLGLSGRSGWIEFTDPFESEWKHHTELLETNSSSTDAIPSITVHDLLEEFSDQFVPFIVKLDVEGAERDVFSFDPSWIDRVPLIIIKPYDWMFPRKRSFGPFLEAIASANRDFVIRGENIFSTSLSI